MSTAEKSILWKTIWYEFCSKFFIFIDFEKIQVIFQKLIFFSKKTQNLNVFRILTM